MGTYPKEKLVKLERLLLAQHEEKQRLQKARKSTDPLKTPETVAVELNMPEPYVRRYAWERRLDPFPGHRESNDIWLAAYAVVFLGWSVREAAADLGFTHQSIENYLHQKGWKRFVCWGDIKSKNLAIPKPFFDEGWKVKRQIPGIGSTKFDNTRGSYFSKRRH